MPTAKAVLVAPNGTEAVDRLLFDTACNKTFVLSQIVDRLGIEAISSKSMKVTTFSTQEITLDSSLVKLQLRRLDGSDTFHMTAYTSPSICAPQPSMIVSQFDHLRDLQLADPYDARDKDVPVTILVGADQCYNFVGDDIIRGKIGPVATSSKFGWLSTGKLNCIPQKLQTESPQASCGLHCMASDTSQVSFKSECQQMWKLETIRVTDDDNSSKSNNFLKDITFSGGRYTVGFLWRDGAKSLLPSNFFLVSTRLLSNLNTLNQHPSLLNEYCNIISDQEAAGIIEKVLFSHNDSSVHYLPHQQ